MSPVISAAFTSRSYCRNSPLNFSNRISSSTYILAQMVAIPIIRATNAGILPMAIAALANAMRIPVYIGTYLSTLRGYRSSL